MYSRLKMILGNIRVLEIKLLNEILDFPYIGSALIGLVSRGEVLTSSDVLR